MIEAAGLGGATLPLVLLPGLLAAGIGSMVFIGLGSSSGLSTAAWSLSPFPLPAFDGPGWGDFAWTIVLAIATAVVVFAIMELARRAKRAVDQPPFPLTILAGLVVGGLAIAYAEATDNSPNTVLFSGEEAFGALFAQAATVSLGTLALLIVFKGLAWSISLGSFRGGPTFPALFLGVVAGLMASHLPGYAETQAVAALMRRRLRRRPPAPTRLRHDRHAALSQSRARGRAADRRGRSGRIPHKRGAHRVRRRPSRSRPRPRDSPPSAHARAARGRRIRRRVARHNPVDERRNGMRMAIHHNEVSRRSWPYPERTTT